MSATGVLMRLGASTAEAVAKALDRLCAESVERGDVAVVAPGASPFEGFDGPAVAVSVAYVDGVAGGNVLLLTPRAAARIAAADGAPAASAQATPELGERELAAVAEAAGRVFAAAASATGVVLGHAVATSAPRTQALPAPAAAAAREAFEDTPYAIVTTLTVCGEPCRLVQLVPNAFVVRLMRAVAEQSAESDVAPLAGDGGDGARARERSLEDALRDIRVRVWAELGRVRVSVGEAPSLPPGAVLELDRKADDPVDLYVNGLRLGAGRLVVDEDGEWALRLTEVAGRTASSGA